MRWKQKAFIPISYDNSNETQYMIGQCEVLISNLEEHYFSVYA